MIRFALATLGFLFASPDVLLAKEIAAVADYQIAPWKLGMSRDEVLSFAESGPYEAVAITGGLETQNALLEGRKINVSFVFDDKGVSFIQAWKYEGPDFEEAKDAALEVFDLFSQRFGGIEVPGIQVNGSDLLNREDFEAMLVSFVGRAPEVLGKLQEETRLAATLTLDLIPSTQPSTSRLHSQIVYSTKHEMFWVFIFQDPVGAPTRLVPANIHIEKL